MKILWWIAVIVVCNCLGYEILDYLYEKRYKVDFALDVVKILQGKGDQDVPLAYRATFGPMDTKRLWNFANVLFHLFFPLLIISAIYSIFKSHKNQSS